MTCASSTALRMARTVFSMLTTTPLRRPPAVGAHPRPTISTWFSRTSPTTAQILVVPISKPTMSSWGTCVILLTLVRLLQVDEDPLRIVEVDAPGPGQVALLGHHRQNLGEFAQLSQIVVNAEVQGRP